MFWEGLLKNSEGAGMFSDDLLNISARAAGELAMMIKEGKKISDRGYQEELLREILLHLEHQLKAVEVKKRQGPKRVFVFLPENVPVIPFQLVPLISSYELDVTFKAPSSEKTFYEILGEKTGFKFVWISHGEAFRQASANEFVIGFGGKELGEKLKALGVPYRFFGPKFSLAFVESDDLYLVMEDALSFDGEACLAPVFIFMEEPDFELAWEALERASVRRPPQLSFNKDIFEYATSFLLYYSKSFRIGEDFALFYIDRFPHLIPQRTVFLLKGSEEEAIRFLGERSDMVQAIITRRNPMVLMERTSASLVLPPGRSQLPPLSWFFQKGLTLANFFSL